MRSKACEKLCNNGNLKECKKLCDNGYSKGCKKLCKSGDIKECKKLCDNGYSKGCKKLCKSGDLKECKRLCDNGYFKGCKELCDNGDSKGCIYKLIDFFKDLRFGSKYPTSISELNEIKELDLSKLGLKSIPKEIANLTNLHILDLYNN